MKKCLSIFLAFGLIGSALMAPSVAQEPAPTEVPEVVNIEDPAGDANYLGGDQTTPADLTVSDILKVWFTHDAENISMHFMTEGPPPSSNASYVFRVNFNPSPDDEIGCLAIEAIVEGPTYVGEPFGRLRYFCEDKDPIEEGTTLTVEEGPDGVGITTVTFPRSIDPAFADGAVLAAPLGEALNNTGAEGVGRVANPTADDTAAGTDYTITPAEEEEPPEKKGCKKGSPKAKKKGCKK